MTTNGPSVYQRVLDVLPDGSTLFAAPCEASELRHGHTFTLEIEIGFVDITFAVVKVAWNEIVSPRDKIDTLFREFIATIGAELAHNSEQLTFFWLWIIAYASTPVSIQLAPQPTSHGCHYMTPMELMRKMHQPYPRVDRQTSGTSKRENDFKFQPPVLIASIPRPDGMSSGPSAACLACRKEQTAAPGFSMSQCGKYKLVRFVPRLRLLVASKAEKHNAKHLPIHERMAGWSDWNQLKIGAAGLLGFASAFDQNCTELIVVTRRAFASLRHRTLRRFEL
ncbi:hypothetical protein B0H19DRAFT_1072143 [Mycena capillaripes]|nr:hypothetical protein B0H19DRAFT_1072143 [Mycena capillaripes]